MKRYAKQVRQHTGVMETDTIQKNGAREKILINNYILPNTTGLQPVRLICLTRTASPIGGVVDDWWDDF